VSRLLIVSPSVPGYNRAGGDRRLYTILQILARRHRVTLLALYPHPPAEQERYRQAMEQCGVEVIVGLRRPSLKEILARGYDAAILEFYRVSELLADEIRFQQPSLPIAIDTVDVHYVREMRMAEVLGDARLLAQARQTQRRELAAYRKADLLIMHTEEDGRAVQQEDPTLETFVIPVVYEARGVSSREGRRPNSLLFVGWFGHPPNGDGLLWFCREILPRVRRELPDVHLTVVGGDAPPEIQALHSDHVTLTGRVESVHPYLDAHCVSIAPLRYGSGMKNKIVEAMGSSIPTVMTTVGAEGIGLENGRHAFVADTPEEFAHAIIRLCQDESLWRTISEEGRRFVQERYSPEAIEARLELLLEKMSTLRPKRLTLAEKFPLLRRKAFEKIVGRLTG
jgi:glycosyltransferase involved in cell wall biosynthesis